MRDRRAFALHEVELEAHRPERQQQIGEENRGVDVDHVDRLQRDRGGEIRLAADVEQRIALTQRPVLGHVAAGLAHEPDGGGVDRLSSAGSEEPIVHAGTRVFASAIRSSSHMRLEPDRGAQGLDLDLQRFGKEIIAGDDRNRALRPGAASTGPAAGTGDRW